MNPLSYSPVFLLGLVVGSFLNVVIYRYNTGSAGWRIIAGRSQCLSCTQTLRWFELVPLFSFFLQRGRCRHCLSKISWQYPTVEVATGLLFALIFSRFLLTEQTLLWLLLHWALFSLLLVITAYDLRHKIIPDGLVYAFSGLALWSALLGPGAVGAASHLLAGLGLFAFFFLLWWLSGGRWMGFGDAKLALGVGFLLGPAGALSAVIFAFWSGALVGMSLLIYGRLSGRGKSFTMKSEIPFAPFIVLGLLFNFFFNFYVATSF